MSSSCAATPPATIINRPRQPIAKFSISLNHLHVDTLGLACAIVARKYSPHDFFFPSHTGIESGRVTFVNPVSFSNPTLLHSSNGGFSCTENASRKPKTPHNVKKISSNRSFKVTAKLVRCIRCCQEFRSSQECASLGTGHVFGIVCRGGQFILCTRHTRSRSLGKRSIRTGERSV